MSCIYACNAKSCILFQGISRYHEGIHMPPIGVSQVKNPNLTMSFTIPRSRHVEF